MEARNTPSESQWAELRESQRLTTSVPKTAMAVAIDVGEWNDIHPFTKDVVGERLALHARKMVYGESTLTAASPAPSTWRFEKSSVTIRFSEAGKGLVCRGGKPGAFAISSDGRRFVWASARVDGDRVVVWSKEITNPVAVRYAWADNPLDANLFSADGLPVVPFQIKK